MSVEQARNIIDHTKAFHRMASVYFHRLADSTQRDRVKLLLDYMSEHELRLAHSLAEYEESAPDRVLNTWFQSSCSTDAISLVADTETVAEMSVDEVVEMGIKLSECVLDVYQDLAYRAEPESVRQVFANLLNMEEKALQQFVRDAGRLADL